MHPRLTDLRRAADTKADGAPPMRTLMKPDRLKPAARRRPSFRRRPGWSVLRRRTRLKRPRAAHATERAGAALQTAFEQAADGRGGSETRGAQATSRRREPEAGFEAGVEPAGAEDAETRGLAVARGAGGPQDLGSYSCECGLVFLSPVSTSVSCPHCGAEQSW